MRGVIEWFRQWLGIAEDLHAVHQRINLLQIQVDDMQRVLDAEVEWRREFVSSLRGKAKERPLYTSFESSQIAVLEEFREG